MGKRTKKQEAERVEAIKHLQKVCPPGTTIYCVAKHVSRSGMLRTIDFYVGKGCNMQSIAGYISVALDMRGDWKRGGLKVSGCGMDMGFHVVHNLSYTLHGMVAKGDGVKAQKTGTPFKARRGHFRPGYSLGYAWL